MHNPLQARKPTTSPPRERAFREGQNEAEQKRPRGGEQAPRRSPPEAAGAEEGRRQKEGHGAERLPGESVRGVTIGEREEEDGEEERRLSSESSLG